MEFNNQTYNHLQGKLTDYKNRIGSKRAEARNLFDGIRYSKEADLKPEIDELRSAFRLDDKSQKKDQTTEQYIEELTAEEILLAIENICTIGEVKFISAVEMRENLRKTIAARLMVQSEDLPVVLRYIAQASDYMEMLDNFHNEIAGKFGGAVKIFEKSINHLETSKSSISARFDAIKSKITPPSSFADKINKES